MFRKQEADRIAQELLDEIRKLAREVAKLRGEKEAIDEQRRMATVVLDAPVQVPKPRTEVEQLLAEVEEVCALAR